MLTSALVHNSVTWRGTWPVSPWPPYVTCGSISSYLRLAITSKRKRTQVRSLSQSLSFPLSPSLALSLSVTRSALLCPSPPPSLSHAVSRSCERALFPRLPLSPLLYPNLSVTHLSRCGLAQKRPKPLRHRDNASEKKHHKFFLVQCYYFDCRDVLHLCLHLLWIQILDYSECNKHS